MSIHADYIMVLVGDMYIEENEALALGLITELPPDELDEPEVPPGWQAFSGADRGSDSFGPIHFNCRSSPTTIILDDVYDSIGAEIFPPDPMPQRLLTYAPHSL